MKGAGWFKCSGTFSTSRYCSVIRLCCLDELLKQRQIVGCHLYHLRDMSSKEDPVVLVEPLAYEGWCFIFVFLCKKWQHLFLDGILKERSCKEVLEEFVKIADLFSFLISFALKKEEQESSLDFANCAWAEKDYFHFEQRTKVCVMSFRVTFDSGDNTLSCNLGKCECVLSSCCWIQTQDLQMAVFLPWWEIW